MSLVEDSTVLEQGKKDSLSCDKQYDLVFFLMYNCFLTLLLPVPYWAGANTDLDSNSKIPKTLSVNSTFTGKVFKEHLISFLMIPRLIDFALVAL